MKVDLVADDLVVRRLRRLSVSSASLSSPVYAWRGRAGESPANAGFYAPADFDVPRLSTVGSPPVYAVFFNATATRATTLQAPSSLFPQGYLLGARPFSVEAWVILSDDHAGDASNPIVQFGPLASSPCSGFVYGVGAGPRGAVWHGDDDGCSTPLYNSSSTVQGGAPARMWRHIAFTYGGDDDPVERVHLNGQVTASLSRVFSPVPPGDIYLGAMLDTTVRQARGGGNFGLARFRQHDGQLTPDDVASNFAAEAGLFGLSPPSAAPLVAAVTPVCLGWECDLLISLTTLSGALIVGCIVACRMRSTSRRVPRGETWQRKLGSSRRVANPLPEGSRVASIVSKDCAESLVA